MVLGEIRGGLPQRLSSVPETRAGIGRYLGFCNAVRPHSVLGGRTPDQIYFDQPLLAAA